CHLQDGVLARRGDERVARQREPRPELDAPLLGDFACDTLQRPLVGSIVHRGSVRGRTGRRVPQGGSGAACTPASTQAGRVYAYRWRPVDATYRVAPSTTGAASAPPFGRIDDHRS